MADDTRILRPTEGIQIIDDITDQFGIETLEGKIGLLIQGVGCRSQFFDLPPGLYTHEHPHPTESIIYTVRGRYVLVTAGQRHVMNPGSLFWFGPEVAAGYEVPFDEPAFILIFKGDRGQEREAFVDYIQNTLRPMFERDAAAGEVFWLRDLPTDHPARVFARDVNPHGGW